MKRLSVILFTSFSLLLVFTSSAFAQDCQDNQSDIQYEQIGDHNDKFADRIINFLGFKESDQARIMMDVSSFLDPEMTQEIGTSIAFNYPKKTYFIGGKIQSSAELLRATVTFNLSLIEENCNGASPFSTTSYLVTPSGRVFGGGQGVTQDARLFKNLFMTQSLTAASTMS